MNKSIWERLFGAEADKTALEAIQEAVEEAKAEEPFTLPYIADEGVYEGTIIKAQPRRLALSTGRGIFMYWVKIPEGPHNAEFTVVVSHTQNGRASRAYGLAYSSDKVQENVGKKIKVHVTRDHHEGYNRAHIVHPDTELGIFDKPSDID